MLGQPHKRAGNWVNSRALINAITEWYQLGFRCKPKTNDSRPGAHQLRIAFANSLAPFQAIFNFWLLLVWLLVFKFSLLFIWLVSFLSLSLLIPCICFPLTAHRDRNAFALAFSLKGRSPKTFSEPFADVHGVERDWCSPACEVWNH